MHELVPSCRDQSIRVSSPAEAGEALARRSPFSQRVWTCSARLPRLFKQEGDVMDIPLDCVPSCIPLRTPLGGVVKHVFHLEDDVIAKDLRWCPLSASAQRAVPRGSR